MPFDQLRAVVVRLIETMTKVCASWDNKEHGQELGDFI